MRERKDEKVRSGGRTTLPHILRKVRLKVVKAGESEVATASVLPICRREVKLNISNHSILIEQVSSSQVYTHL